MVGFGQGREKVGEKRRACERVTTTTTLRCARNSSSTYSLFYPSPKRHATASNLNHSTIISSPGTAGADEADGLVERAAAVAVKPRRSLLCVLVAKLESPFQTFLDRATELPAVLRVRGALSCETCSEQAQMLWRWPGWHALCRDLARSVRQAFAAFPDASAVLRLVMDLVQDELREELERIARGGISDALRAAIARRRGFESDEEYDSADEAEWFERKVKRQFMRSDALVKAGHARWEDRRKNSQDVRNLLRHACKTVECSGRAHFVGWKGFKGNAGDPGPEPRECERLIQLYLDTVAEMPDAHGHLGVEKRFHERLPLAMRTQCIDPATLVAMARASVRAVRRICDVLHNHHTACKLTLCYSPWQRS